MGLNSKLVFGCLNAVRRYSVQTCKRELRCKLLVVGGGAGGCSMAWRFSRKLGRDDIIVLEPSQVHYYQPLFTLVAAGIKPLSASMRPQKSVLPPGARWVPASVAEFDPCSCLVYTSNGDKIYYQYMIVAVGLVNDYEKIPGLKQALDDPASGVSTIYSAQYCAKSRCDVRALRGGHAVFTFTRAPAKCSGAAQKIMYLADDYWRKKKLRHLTSITYNTGGQSIFGVAKYREALERVAARRRVAVNHCQELQRLEETGAVFVDHAGKSVTLPYNLLHVTPPMSPPACLRRCTELVSADGHLAVDRLTLQHSSFCNIFGIGDCLNTPNSKTAAAVARQSSVVEHNLTAVMFGKSPDAQYDGYGACPLLTSYSTGILAEFIYDKQPCETFPFDQSKERRLFYFMKTKVLPYIYWNKLLKGKWDGPAKIRKIINPFGK